MALNQHNKLLVITRKTTTSHGEIADSRIVISRHPPMAPWPHLQREVPNDLFELLAKLTYSLGPGTPGPQALGLQRSSGCMKVERGCTCWGYIF